MGRDEKSSVGSSRDESERVGGGIGPVETGLEGGRGSAARDPYYASDRNVDTSTSVVSMKLSLAFR